MRSNLETAVASVSKQKISLITSEFAQRFDNCRAELSESVKVDSKPEQSDTKVQ
jgi:hypothetical protein